MLPMPFSNPNTYPGHSGVDFPQSGGTVIPASGPGTVTLCSYTQKGGYWTWIDYDGYPLEAGYAHQDSGAGRPAMGSRVGEFTQLGYVGSLGLNSTGNHLHLEIDGDGTTDGVFRMFDRNRVVGGGGSSGGGGFSQLVKDQQNFMISRGYDLGPSGADGIAGDYYHSAVRAYQGFLKKNYGYTGEADGEWGPATQAAHARYYSDLARPNPNAPLALDGEIGPATIRKLQTVLGVNADGEWGPATTSALQAKLITIGYKIDKDGALGPATIRALQTFLIGADKADGIMGPVTIKGLQNYLNVGGKFTVTKPVAPPVKPIEPPVIPESEDELTPKVVTPSAGDFHEWINYDVTFDPDQTSVTLNKDAAAYYGVPYNPIEAHLHWWNESGKGGTHNANVGHFANSADLSVNYVVSEDRITLMVPLNKIAYTTGKRNPYGWKMECDPTLTDEQYKTMGYLVYIVEKLNPSLANEKLRLHKEFAETGCSDIKTDKVRSYAEKFRTGALDPKTGKPKADTPSDTITVPRTLIEGLPNELRKLASEIDGYLK